ncbi:MAG: bifunctional demethylmenaquinone methyltransferase/2-methoxy-6-polyprenyl-1,4-benzoquinol methylase UbiE [Planctomycetaceae bacterium]
MTSPVNTVVATPGVDKSGTRVRSMFGEIAGRYDLLNHVLSLGVDVYWRWRTVRTIPPVGTEPLLDVCTGTGDLAMAYARKSAEEVAIIGADFTPQMLQIAREKGATAQRAKKIRHAPAFVEADAQALPFASNQFQIVSVSFGLRNVADTRRGLRELTRVCRPGGHVAVLEFSQPSSRLFGAVYRWYFKHVLPRIGQLVSGSRLDAYNYLPQSVGEFPNGQALADVMVECGLSEVRFRPLTFGIATLYWGRKPIVEDGDGRA